MEIPKQQFQQKLSAIEEAIKECDVIAIDTELSGKLS
jgi:chaperonin cofactor prefoldin